MKIISSLLLLILLTGCGPPGAMNYYDDYYYYDPTYYDPFYYSDYGIYYERTRFYNRRTPVKEKAVEKPIPQDQKREQVPDRFLQW